MTKEIALTRGKVVTVDDEDYERVKHHKWQATPGKKTWYAQRTVVRDGGKHNLLLHRFILNAPKGVQVDHRDGNGLNCTRDNLRLCNHTQNSQNRSGNKKIHCPYKGVTYRARLNTRQWEASIAFNKKDVYLGRFATAEEAARAYDKAARELHGEFAKTNF